MLRANSNINKQLRFLSFSLPLHPQILLFSYLTFLYDVEPQFPIIKILGMTPLLQGEKMCLTVIDFW